MDSVYSDVNKPDSKESDNCDSQTSDDLSPSKDVFKSIRTRYLSRVHSVTDPPAKEASLIEQAFFKSNASESKNDLNDPLTDEFKIEIENVTTDETNDDDSPKPSEEEHPSRVLAEIVLPPFETKELKRQNAIDFYDELNGSPPVVPELPKHLIDLNHSFRLIKSDSSFAPIPRARTIFSTNISGTLNGKPKSYSMDNLNTNEEYKEALNEATSVDFLTINTQSETSLFTEGSDSVFLSPIEKNNNNNEKINLPVVKAEEVLPFPYPHEIKKVPAIDLMPANKNILRDINIDDKVEKQLKMVNEELKLTFKTAIERIIGNNRTKRGEPCTKVLKENDEESTSEPASTKDEIDNINKSRKISPPSIPKILESEPQRDSKPKVVDTKENNNLLTTNVNVSSSPKDESSNPFIDPKNDNIPPEPTTPVPIDDNVSYHLTINTTDLGDDIPKTAPAQRILNVDNNRAVNTFRTFLAPIQIGNGNIAPTSPVIISPVLIQPVFFKPLASQEVPLEQKQEAKKGTVYYSDIDEVDTDNKTNAKITEVKNPEDNTKRKGLYQKNIKAKQLPFLSWKTFESNENLPERKTPSPIKNIGKPLPSPSPLEISKTANNFSKTPIKPLEPPKTVGIVQKASAKPSEANPTVGKLSKTPQLLIDNKYYRPVASVPFVINSTQSLNPKLMDTSKEDFSIAPANPFSSQVEQRRYSEQENVYEEIGPVISEVITKDNKNIADDEKISNKNQSLNDELVAIPREDLLKVPRRIKRPKTYDRFTKSKSLDYLESTSAAKEMASITKSIISLSKAPSAKEDLPKKTTTSIGEIVQSLENKPDPDVPMEVAPRKFSLQHPTSPSIDTNTGSLPREKPYWRTLEHKRLSHPLRSLKDPPPRRPLRKSALL